jgi:hypothetical protein
MCAALADRGRRLVLPRGAWKFDGGSRCISLSFMAMSLTRKGACICGKSVVTQPYSNQHLETSPTCFFAATAALRPWSAAYVRMWGRAAHTPAHLYAGRGGHHHGLPSSLVSQQGQALANLVG